MNTRLEKVRVSGSTSSARVAALPLHSRPGQWGPTILGLAILITLSLTALRTVLGSQGVGQPPTITPAEIRLSSAVSPPRAVQSTTETPVTLATPKRLLLPSVEIGLDVIDSNVIVATNSWPLTPGNAHYANFTPKLGSKKGTLLLYGHATWAVLGKTSNLAIGDPLVLVDEHGSAWHFTLSQTKNILPEEVSFIYEDVPFRVVIFTCYGWNNEYRRLMYFTPAAESDT